MCYSQVILFCYITLHGIILCQNPGVHAGALPLMITLMNGEHHLVAANAIAQMASASNQEVKNAIIDCMNDAGDWHATEFLTVSKPASTCIAQQRAATQKQHTAALLATEASNQCLTYMYVYVNVYVYA